MPAFDFNPADAVSGFQVFPKETYQVELGEPKSFYRSGKDGKEDNYGVMFVSKIAEGSFKGKKIVVNCYMHMEESRGFSKQYQMAAYGYTPPKDEEKFNADHAGDDWKFNPDDKSCGNGWQGMKGQVIELDLDVKIDNQGNQQQQTKSIRPIKAS